ncbi:MAG TPA: hypothetical protein VFZ79_11025 [Acidimicrobiales bacterium]
MATTAGATGTLQQVDEAVAAGDLDGAVAHLSAAIRRLTAAGDDRAAAMACARLGDLYANGLGSKVAARPWFRRAMRLVEGDEPCVEQGWAALAPMGCDVEDPEVLLARADMALDRARRFGDADLEVKALADGGLARVHTGQVAEGMAMIDEAMALACSGVDHDADVVGRSVCSFYTACYYTADFERAESWSRTFRQRGILGPEPGPQVFLSSHCDSVQATLLCHLGRWSEAEDLLVRAQAAFEQVMPVPAWHPPIALADLRILQGRLAEAEALLLGRDDQIEALVPTARLHLARGDHDLARATARRGLRMMADDRVRTATLLGVLVDAELGRDDVAAARAASAELDRRTGDLGLPVLDAEAARLRARVRAADGDPAAAVAALHDGLDAVRDRDLPLLTMTLHRDLARVHEAAGDRAAAVVEARAVAALLGRLDVVPSAGDTALLGGLGVDVATGPAAEGCRVATLAADRAWFTAACGDTQVRLRATKGLQYLADLVAHPGVERHVLDLVDLVEGVATGDAGTDRRRLGDAGELLDARARAAYRRRLTELRDEAEEALAVEDDARAARAQAEIDALVAELSRAFGLGGRARRASSVAERARLNVTRALRAALANLVGALPEAGALLDQRIRTGVFCAYEPHPDDGAVWTVPSRLNGDGSD